MKWEYTFVDFQNDEKYDFLESTEPGMVIEALTFELNLFGNQGWEVVSVDWNEGVMLFKRQIPLELKKSIVFDKNDSSDSF